jgi:hypothetical protein
MGGVFSAQSRQPQTALLPQPLSPVEFAPPKAKAGRLSKKKLPEKASDGADTFLHLLARLKTQHDTVISFRDLKNQYQGRFTECQQRQTKARYLSFRNPPRTSRYRFTVPRLLVGTSPSSRRFVDWQMADVPQAGTQYFGWQDLHRGS